MISPLTLHLVELIEIDVLRSAIYRQDNGKADSNLCCRNRYHEQTEDLTLRCVTKCPQRNEIEVHRVENQLDRHQDHHAVLARDHAIDAKAEQDRSESEILSYLNRHLFAPRQDDRSDQGSEQ